MADETQCIACLAACWYFTFWVLVVACGSFAVDRFTEFDAYAGTGVAELSSVYAMGRDWDQKTFTSLEVVDPYYQGCPDGYEDAYNRVFYGIDIACDCLGRYGRYLNTEN